MSKFFNDKDVPRLRMGQDLVTKCASTWTGSLSSLRLSCVVSWSSRLLLACHVTAAKMLPPLVWHVSVQRRVYRRVQSGSNFTSPRPPDPGFVGLRLTCGGGFASRAVIARPADSFICGKNLKMCTLSGNAAARSVFFCSGPP